MTNATILAYSFHGRNWRNRPFLKRLIFPSLTRIVIEKALSGLNSPHDQPGFSSNKLLFQFCMMLYSTCMDVLSRLFYRFSIHSIWPSSKNINCYLAYQAHSDDNNSNTVMWPTKYSSLVSYKMPSILMALHSCYEMYSAINANDYSFSISLYEIINLLVL